MGTSIHSRNTTQARGVLALASIALALLYPPAEAEAIQDFESRLRFSRVRPSTVIGEIEDFWHGHDDRPGGRRDMGIALGRTSPVHYIRLDQDGSLEMALVPRIHVSRSCPKCFTWDSKNYFTSLRAAILYFDYGHQNGGWSRTEDVIRVNHALARGCRNRAPIGARASIDFMKRVLCDQEENLFRGGRVKYRLERKHDAIHIKLNLRFKMADSIDGSKHESFHRRVRSCMAEMEKSWTRYGVRLNLRSDTSRRPKLRSYDRLITLHSGSGRSNSFNIFMGTKKLCSTVIHELGHALGLSDEYEDPKSCPDRETVTRQKNPHSYMAQHRKPKTEFFPSHIVEIIEPICTL